MPKLRTAAHIKGFAISYTFGVTEKMTIYPWRQNGGRTIEIDMSDTAKGKREAWKFIKSFKV
jgi:hypothetical protein